MKWFNINSTTISAIGTASRRDVVIMMVMDRSGSMNSNNGCANMRSAAKIFTGQFAAGRDMIGMVEFGDTAWIDSIPTTDFQTVLGYTNNSGSGSGLIDTIVCGDNTNTPEALSLGYNTLYQANLPGAFNILMFFTDGIPNSSTLNFQSVMMSTSGCQDSTGKAINLGGSFVTKSAELDDGLVTWLGHFHPQHTRWSNRSNRLRRSNRHRKLWGTPVSGILAE